MPRKINETEKRKKMALYIEAAQSLIEEEGFGSISIRKIAERVGFHNSTIYFYFSDLDLLISLAAVRQFERYSSDLTVISQMHISAYESFFRIWKSFCTHTFGAPDLFYHFFFGKHSDKLDEIIRLYYELFPEEKRDYSDVIDTMYYGRSLSERCMYILQTLVQAGEGRFSSRDINTINKITVLSYKSLLLEIRELSLSEPEGSSPTDTAVQTDLYVKQFLDIMHYLIDKPI